MKESKMKLFNEKTYQELEKRVDKSITQKEVQDVVETLRALNKEDSMFRYLRSIGRSIDIFSVLANDDNPVNIRGIIVGHYNLLAITYSGSDTNICEDNYKVYAEILVQNGLTSQKIVKNVENALNTYMIWDKPK